MKINSFVKFPLVLGIVGAICAGALGVVYEVTNPIIQERINLEANAAISELIPEMDPATDTTKDLTPDLDAEVLGQHKLSSVKEVTVDNEVFAYAYQVAGSGRNGDIVMIVVISAKEQKVLNLKVLSQSETGDYWNKLVTNNVLDNFKDASFDDISAVADLKVGATVSLSGVVDGVQKAVKFHRENILGEESTGIELTDGEITKLALAEGQTLADGTETFVEKLKTNTGKYESIMQTMGFIQFIEIKDASEATVGYIYLVEGVYNCEVADHQRADQKFKLAYMFDKDWKNSKIVVLSSSDSMKDMPNPQPALGDNEWMNQFNGLSISELSAAVGGAEDKIIGATFTSTAIKNNIKAVVNAHTRAFGSK
ncbi:MAG: FMN-binding protein [Bacilli bacterium]|nr:FMN-binding protein [Bacilli bacterium]